MAKGKKTHISVLGQIKPLNTTWNVPYYSNEKYVVGVDEEDCLNKIRPMLKNKYEGFRVIKQKEI
jgi:hypothetical protein